MELIIELTIITALSALQSVFGVGLLLFGTPAFLLIGYNFESTLGILLPVSISISLLQIVNQKTFTKSHINEYNTFCLPALFVILFITINIGNIAYIKQYVLILLIISALLILNANRILLIHDFFLKYRKLALVFIGSIHGFTNMGGGFLSIFSTVLNAGDKNLSRNYIAYGYFTMGVIQYVVILLFGVKNIDLTKLFYILIPLVLFFPSQKLFSKIDDKIFMRLINYFALIFGVIALSISFK
tara:strand:- start:383 stop:1111 length:729 start_codon:yes stop_codon:yes gene_type:complete